MPEYFLFYIKDILRRCAFMSIVQLTVSRSIVSSMTIVNIMDFLKIVNHAPQTQYVCVKILLLIKYFYILPFQMEIIRNRSIPFTNRLFSDVLLQSLLLFDEQLFAFLAIERWIHVVRSVLFDQEASQKMAKRLIPISLLTIVLTYIHHSIYHRLIDEQGVDEPQI